MPVLLLAWKLLHNGYSQMRLYRVRHQLVPFLLVRLLVRLMAWLWRRLAVRRLVCPTLAQVKYVFRV